MKLKTVGALLLPLAVAACGATNSPAPEGQTAEIPTISADRVKAHMAFLADDALRGRGTGTNEYTIAANYVATQYRMMGLKPAGEDKSYFQPVKFAAVEVDGEKSSFTLVKDGKETSVAYKKEFVTQANAGKLTLSESTDDILFVGYGTAEAVKGLDLKGKTVAILPGKASAVGDAAAVIYLKTKARQKRVPYQASVNYYAASSMAMLNKDESVFGASDATQITVSVNNEVSEKMAVMAGKTLDGMEEEAKAEGFKPYQMAYGAKMQTTTKRGATVNSPNVAAVLEGSDPKLKNEYVVISAHLDHVGHVDDGRCHQSKRDTAGDDDLICNGAMDNAAGISTMLEAAGALVKGKAPKRSVIFIALAAEELGLRGAQYFMHNPTVPVDQMVANVNLDMPILTYNFADVVAFGAEHSTIAEIVKPELKKMNIGLADDPMPEQNLFTRSDHYRFVQKGVPSVFLMSGPNEVGQPEGSGLTKFRKFLGTNYHSPADDMNQPLKFDVAAKFSLANYLIITAIANADVEPMWYEGNPYGDRFAPTRKKAPKAK